MGLVVLPEPVTHRGAALAGVAFAAGLIIGAAVTGLVTDRTNRK